MSAEETKQRILDVALKQFAQLGYSTASIRSICGEVGIKESSVYYHFKNKQHILDSLIGEFEAMAGGMNQMLESAFQGADLAAIRDEDFLRIGRMYYMHFLNNERNLQFIRMLMIEQQDNAALGALFGRMMFDRPIEMQTRFFAILTASGYLKNLPAGELAAHYQSILNFCFFRQLAMRESADEAAQRLINHLNFFIKQYKGGKT